MISDDINTNIKIENNGSSEGFLIIENNDFFRDDQIDNYSHQITN